MRLPIWSAHLLCQAGRQYLGRLGLGAVHRGAWGRAGWESVTPWAGVSAGLGCRVGWGTCPGPSRAEWTDHSPHPMPLAGIPKLCQIRTINVLLRSKSYFQTCFIPLLVCFKGRSMWQCPWSPERNHSKRGDPFTFGLGTSYKHRDLTYWRWCLSVVPFTETKPKRVCLTGYYMKLNQHARCLALPHPPFGAPVRPPPRGPSHCPVPGLSLHRLPQWTPWSPKAPPSLPPAGARAPGKTLSSLRPHCAPNKSSPSWPCRQPPIRAWSSPLRPACVPT